MLLARRVFHWAGVYGLLVLVPQYFLEARNGRDFPPPITHPEHVYGFIGVAVVVLYLGGRTTAMMPGFAGVDILLGGLFLVAFQRLRSVS